MKKKNTKSYSKFTLDDIKALGLRVELVDLFKGEKIVPIAPSIWLKEALARVVKFSLNTEKAKSEFIIAPVINELCQNNAEAFAVYSGFNFTVEPENGLQGFCDFLLAKLPLSLTPETPIIAIVEAKLDQQLSAAIPQCGAELYAARLWNEKRGEPQQVVYGVVTTGDLWLFVRLRDAMVIEVDLQQYSILQLDMLLGVWQHIINKVK